MAAPVLKDKFAQRIKRILLKRGVLEEQKADEALDLAVKQDKPYAEILLEREFLDEPTYLWAVADEVNLPPIDVDRIQCEDDALSVLNQELSTYYGVLPISKLGDILTLAVGNPFDILKLDDVRLVTNCDLRPVVSTERAIRRAIARAYNPDQANMENLLESLGEEESSMEVKRVQEEAEVDLSAISDDSGESPIIKIVNMLILQAIKERASDIHIEPFEKRIQVRYRRDGVLHEVPSPPRPMHNSIISRVKVMADLDIAERRIPQDGKFQVKYEGRQIDFRVSILPTIHGEKGVLRVLDSSSLNLGIEKLGFEKSAEEAFRRAIGASYGMILVTGPTGSGKSTTLYAALKEMLNPEENVVTVEDPVEYQLEGVIQVPVNPKRGLTFAGALRSILRQDPDIVMIGEIRDHETADIAVKAALTGHLVLSTLHTNDAASAITRLIDMGIDSFMVSSSVLLVAAQRLCRKLCDGCKAPLENVPPKDHLLSLGFKSEDLKDAKLSRAVGCTNCTGGYRGRFAILEALELDEAIRRLIVAGKPATDIKAHGMQKGMLTLRRTALLNAGRARTTLEEVLRVTMGDEL
jgi:type IV pilus assembly protein PilB